MDQSTGDEAPARSWGRSLTQAVVTAVALLAVVALSYVLGRAAFFGLVCVVVLLALFEVLDALLQTGRRPGIVVALPGGLALVVAAYFESAPWIVAAVAAIVFGSLVLALRPARGNAPASDAAWTALTTVWVAGGGAGATAILALEPRGLELLIAFVLITALDDIGAYFSGVRLGRHKLAPSISPAKSWEGVAGGFVVALAGGSVIGSLVDPLTALDGLVLGAIAGVGAPLGDLVESLVKRELNIKDSSRLLPGHGGILDRVDAIIFCAPLAYLYLRYVVAGM